MLFRDLLAKQALEMNPRPKIGFFWIISDFITFATWGKTRCILAEDLNSETLFFSKLFFFFHQSINQHNSKAEITSQYSYCHATGGVISSKTTISQVFLK